MEVARQGMCSPCLVDCISIVSGIIIMDGLGGFRLDISSKTKEMAERKMCVIIIPVIKHSTGSTSVQCF